ncbi:unnamed protein product [Symbiodinium sp. CCMP2592]|nr:unnamed protein product [Symbiodinium sp. CCMP2592]
MTAWSHETRERTFQYVSVLVCLAIAVVAAVLVYWIGPTHLIGEVLLLLPDKPGCGWFAAWAFLLLATVVFMVPLWQAICVASGLMFGLCGGTALNFLALYVAAVICALLGRFLLQEPIRGWLDEGNFPTAKKALQVLEEADDSLEFQILFRFLFIPIWLRNYGPATFHIPLWKLLVAAVPHTLWVSFIMASLGVSLQDANDLVNEGEELKIWDAKWQHLLMFVVSCVMSLLLSWYSYRKYTDMMNGEGKPFNQTP